MESQVDTAAPRMIFVVGNSRSGTTMMGRILGGHPEVFMFRELHFFDEFSVRDRLPWDEAVRQGARLLCTQREGYLFRGNAERYTEEAATMIEPLRTEPISSTRLFEHFLRYETTRNDKTIPCDQTPRNVFHVDTILDAYPGAFVVNMVRDPRDVLLSQKNRWRRLFLGKRPPVKVALRNWFGYHALTTSKIWGASVRAARRMADHERVYVLQYETLVHQPEAELRKLCAFMGLPYDEEMPYVTREGSSIEPDQSERVMIDASRAGNWHKGGLSRTEIFLCQRVNRTLMTDYGYDPAPVKPNPLSLALSLVSFPVKLTGALLFNMSRFQHLFSSIKRRLA